MLVSRKVPWNTSKDSDGKTCTVVQTVRKVQCILFFVFFICIVFIVFILRLNWVFTTYVCIRCKDERNQVVPFTYPSWKSRFRTQIKVTKPKGSFLQKFHPFSFTFCKRLPCAFLSSLPKEQAHPPDRWIWWCYCVSPWLEHTVGLKDRWTLEVPDDPSYAWRTNAAQ